MNITIFKLWKDNKSLLLFILLMFTFRSVLADWNTVPTGSMNPTIVEGDRILVNKLAYDLRIPFTHTSLVKIADPQRGDIVIFESDALDKRLVKRVIGIPGDVISMQNNIIFHNGEKLPYTTVSVTEGFEKKTENLDGITHQIQIAKAGSSASSFPPVTVPNDFYLVLGDNRDNSVDSRFIGFVPRNEIVGRTKKVVLSFNYENYYIPRSERFLLKL